MKLVSAAGRFVRRVVADADSTAGERVARGSGVSCCRSARSPGSSGSQGRHPGGTKERVRFCDRRDGCLRAEPRSDRDDPFTCLGAGQALAFAHFRNHRPILQDTVGQLGLAQAMFAVQIAAQEIAKRMAHTRVLL